MKEFIVRHKRRITAVTICFIVILVVICLAALYIAHITRSDFSPRRWDRHPYRRLYMLEDMKYSIDIWNLTMDEITDILGTNRAYFWPNQINYVINRHPPTTLIISFSENGEVERIYALGS